MAHTAKENRVLVPLIESTLVSNHAQIQHAAEMIARADAQRIGVLGVTFKRDTDDLRESPQVCLIGRLLATGREVRAFDQNITPHGIALAYKHAITSATELRAGLDALPTILTESADELLEWADLVVVSHKTTAFVDAVARHPATALLDLVNLPATIAANPNYAGICW